MIALVEDKKYDEAFELWDEKRDYLSIFLRDNEIDNADLHLRELLAAYNAGEKDVIDEKHVDLIDAVMEIKINETLNLTGIF